MTSRKTQLHHQRIGAMSVPAGRMRVVDLGLSTALMVWTEELRHNDVEHWHRHAVELNSIRNDLRDTDPMDGSQPEVTLPVRLGTPAALIAAAVACAAADAGHDACDALRALALSAEEAAASNDRRLRPRPRTAADPSPRRSAPAEARPVRSRPSPTPPASPTLPTATGTESGGVTSHLSDASESSSTDAAQVALTSLVLNEMPASAPSTQGTSTERPMDSIPTLPPLPPLPPLSPDQPTELS